MGETDFGMLKKTAILKKLTGKDLIPFEKKHGSLFDDFNYAKIFVATNTIPETADKTTGWYRRFIDVDFPNDFTNKEKDVIAIIPDEEFENLATKCLRIAKGLYKNRRFTYEKKIEDKIASYEARSDPLGKFIDEEYERGFEEEYKVPFFEFYDNLISYLKQKRHRRMTKNEVSRRLREAGFETKKRLYRYDDDGRGINAVFILGMRQKTIPRNSPIPSTSTLFPYRRIKWKQRESGNNEELKCHFCGKSGSDMYEMNDVYNQGKKLLVCEDCKSGKNE